MAGESEAVAFTAGPEARRRGEEVVINFAVNRATDVAVYVENAKGEVVRHLVAGVLGENPPAPLEPGLTQRLEWDGKDNAGRAVRVDGCRVRIRAGLLPKFDRMLARERAAVDGVVGLAVAPSGNLFVWQVLGGLHGGSAMSTCKVLDRSGKYVRTALRSVYPAVGQLSRQRPLVTLDGKLVVVGHEEVARTALRYRQTGLARLVVVGADGSVPEPCLGARLRKGFVSPYGSPSLALSPDGKTIYATGLRAPASKGAFYHAVYRCAWRDESFKPFIGNERTSGDGPGSLRDPSGIDTDAEGNIYVADRGNDRIAVFKPDGSPLAQVKVEKPAWVEVHGKTGAMYVLAGALTNQLVKIDGYKSGKEVSRIRLKFRDNRMRFWPVLALDDSARPPVLWLGGGFNYPLRRVEDKANAFSAPTAVSLPGSLRGAGLDIVADQARDEVYVFENTGLVRVEGRTGKRERLPLPKLGRGAVVAVGKDGFVYAHGANEGGAVLRFDRSFKPAPFGSSGSNKVPLPGTLRLHARGITAGYRGDVFVLWQKPDDQKKPGDGIQSNALAHFSPDGKLVNKCLIDAQFRCVNSPRVDAAGNIYLAVGARPGKEWVPEDFRKLDLGKTRKQAFVQPHGFNAYDLNWYALMYGSAVKFGPTGGVIRKGSGGLAANFAYGSETHLKGAEWMCPEACFPSWRTLGTPDVCLCEASCFDVDGFGRSFFPDTLRWQIGVIDARGNRICSFGDYGNADSAGAGSAIPKPDIPLGWAQAVAASDEAVYVTDRLNRRALRVKLTCAADQTVQIK
jgi:DNA-binding beta-propeller fold protein YncE